MTMHIHVTNLQAYLGSSSAATQRLRAQQEARNVAEQLADLRLGARYTNALNHCMIKSSKKKSIYPIRKFMMN